MTFLSLVIHPSLEGGMQTAEIKIIDPFSVGVHLGFLIDQIHANKWWDFVDGGATTTDICESIIKPVTKPYQCSLAEYWSASNNSVFGKPVGFVSHAWMYNFRALLDALVSYFGLDSYIWLDFVFVNQHQAIDYPFNWWRGTFKTAISTIGKTVMVLAPWNDPVPLTRGWCIWELYCSIDSEGCEFDIAMTSESEDAFVKDIENDPIGAVNKMLATIDCANSHCFREEDKMRIHTAVRESIGFSEMNKRLFEALRGWLIRKYKKEMEKRRSELGENHPSTLKSLNNLALLYKNQGDYDKALPLFEECLEKRKLILGNDHRDTLTTLDNLAGFFRSRRDYDKALRLFQECLEKRKSVLGENHPETLVSLNNLAAVYLYQNDYEQSLRLFQDCLTKRKSVLGENHPATLASVNNLALVYENQGNYMAALPLYLDCLKQMTSKFGANHPETLTSLNNLASLYSDQGDYDKALPLYEKSLEKRKLVLGENHQNTLSVIHNIAVVYERQGDYDKALPLYIECLEKRKLLLGLNHPDTIATQFMYDNCLENRK
jgi:tetratricopeptide (TPR) repeat protein